MLVIKNQQLSLSNNRFYNYLNLKPTITVGFFSFNYRIFNSNVFLKVKSDEFEIVISNSPASATNS